MVNPSAMRGAALLHITGGEWQVLPMNAVLPAIPAFILWGRWFKSA